MSNENDVQTFLLEQTQKLGSDIAEIKSMMREGVAVLREQHGALASRVDALTVRVDAQERASRECPARRRMEAYGGVTRDVVAVGAIAGAVATILAVVAKAAGWI